LEGNQAAGAAQPAVHLGPSFRRPRAELHDRNDGEQRVDLRPAIGGAPLAVGEFRADKQFCQDD
jgi:hypothetical protein